MVITGGICTGKSSACAILKELGYRIIDADKVAHKVLDENAFSIAKMFGDEYLRGDRVDRKKLAGIIFSNEKNRRKLEDFLHPLIKDEILKEEKEAIDKREKYVLDIPLFFEKGNYEAKRVVLIYAPKVLQIERLMQRDSLSKKDALLRINSQMDIEKKRELADIVIYNDKDLKNLKRELIDAGF